MRRNRITRHRSRFALFPSNLVFIYLRFPPTHLILSHLSSLVYHLSLSSRRSSCISTFTCPVATNPAIVSLPDFRYRNMRYIFSQVFSCLSNPRNQNLSSLDCCSIQTGASKNCNGSQHQGYNKRGISREGSFGLTRTHLKDSSSPLVVCT